MRRELKNIAEYNKPSNDAFASIVRSLGEANSRFQALAAESVGRAVEIQSEIVSKTYESYISEISKLGRMFFARHSTARPKALLYANLNEKKAAGKHHEGQVEATVNPNAARQRAAAQSVSSKRKIGTAAKSLSGSKRAAKAKGKAGSARRTRG